MFILRLFPAPAQDNLGPGATFPGLEYSVGWDLPRVCFIFYFKKAGGRGAGILMKLFSKAQAEVFHFSLSSHFVRLGLSARCLEKADSTSVGWACTALFPRLVCALPRSYRRRPVLVAMKQASDTLIL